MRRLGLAVGGLAAGVFAVVPSAPAGADPARPTNDRSEVVAVVPPAPGVRVDVVGGDAFLRVRVEDGHEVEVPGYEGEPYLRVGADGAIERNERSPARWLNSSRYGPTDPPPAEADASASPRWSPVGSGGEYVWHDHRVHYMGSGPVPSRWEVPLVVDGQNVTVMGTLSRHAAPSALAWWGLVAVVLAAVVAGSLCARRATAIALAAVGGLGVVVSGAEAAALPAAAGPGPGMIALAALAMVLALGGLVRRPPWLAGPATAGAGAALLVWGVRRAAVLDHAVLLTNLPAAVDRAAVAVALGAGGGALLAGVAAVVGGPHWAARVWEQRAGRARRPAADV